MAAADIFDLLRIRNSGPGDIIRNFFIKYICLLTGGMILLTAGCSKSKVGDLPEIPRLLPSVSSDIAATETRESEGRYHLAGFSVENRPVEYFDIGEGEDLTLIIAGIHGNEHAGTLLAFQLIRYLQNHPRVLKNRRVVILPDANPDGRIADSRYNARGVDLNRNFLTENRINKDIFGTEAFSEPESRIIGQILHEYAPDRIVSIHEPLDCVDYDGPGAEELAANIADCCGLPLRKLGARPGSLGTYAGENLDRPIITLELPENAQELNSEQLWFFYGGALLSSVIYPDKTGDCSFHTEKIEKEMLENPGRGK